MFGLLSTLVNTVSSVISFIISSIQSLLYLLAAIPSYISFLATGIGFLPNPVMTFALVTLSVFVLLFILNR